MSQINNTTTQTHNHKHMLIFILLLVVMGQSAIDIYLPSFPAMVHYFHTTTAMVQLTLSTFLIGYAFSQLIYGPLSDHFGRRPVLIFGFSLFTLASLLCAFSPSITALLIFRFLQGLGAGTSNVHQRAVMRDVFEGNTLMKIASYMAAVWAMVPIIAPIIGGYIQHYLTWQLNFIFLAAAELIFLIAIIKSLPETRRKNANAQLTIKKVITDYKTLLTSRIFLGNTACCALLNSIFLIFNIAGPFLLQVELKLSPVIYGWTLIISAIGFLLGSFSNSRIVQRYGAHKMIISGLSILLLSDLVLLLLLVNHLFTVLSLMLPLFFGFFGIGLVYGNCIAGSMKGFPHIAASAGALYGFLIFVAGGLISALFSHFPVTSPLPLALTILVLLILTVIAYFTLASEHRKT